MQTFPLLNNELTRLSRKRSLHGIRLGVIGLLFGFMAMAALATSFESASAPTEWFGGVIVTVIGFLLPVAAFAIPLVRATDSLAAEKRDGTLPILLLANASPADIVLAKYAIVIVESLSLVLCLAPVHAMSVYFGGISILETLAMVFTIVLFVLVVSAVGIYCSALAKTPLMARIAAIPILACYGAVLVVAQRWATTGFGGAPNETPLWEAAPLLAFLIAFLSASGFLYAAVRRVDKITADPGAGGTAFVPLNRRRPVARSPLRPLLRAGLSGMGLGEHRWIVRLLAVVLFAAIAWIPGVGAWLLYFLVYWDIVTALQRFTQNGGLDDVRVANVTDRELGRAAFFTAFIGASPYLAGLAIGTTLWFLSVKMIFDPTLEPMWFAAVSLLLDPLLAFIYYTAIIIQAVYWGIAWGRRKHTGLYVFFGILVMGGIVNTVMTGFVMFSVPTPDTTASFIWHLYTVALRLVPSLLLIAITVLTYRKLGKHYRADLSPKPLPFTKGPQPTPNV